MLLPVPGSWKRAEVPRINVLNEDTGMGSMGEELKSGMSRWRGRDRPEDSRNVRASRYEFFKLGHCDIQLGINLVLLWYARLSLSHLFVVVGQQAFPSIVRYRFFQLQHATINLIQELGDILVAFPPSLQRVKLAHMLGLPLVLVFFIMSLSGDLTDLDEYWDDTPRRQRERTMAHDSQRCLDRATVARHADIGTFVMCEDIVE